METIKETYPIDCTFCGEEIKAGLDIYCISEIEGADYCSSLCCQRDFSNAMEYLREIKGEKL